LRYFIVGNVVCSRVLFCVFGGTLNLAQPKCLTCGIWWI